MESGLHSYSKPTLHLTNFLLYHTTNSPHFLYFNISHLFISHHYVTPVYYYITCSVLYAVADEGLHDRNIQSTKVMMLCEAQ